VWYGGLTAVDEVCGMIDMPLPMQRMDGARCCCMEMRMESSSTALVSGGESCGRQDEASDETKNGGSLN
jgi:hypothetical protein